MKMSIRSTLLMLLFLVLVLAILINSVLGHMLVRQEVNEVFDAELAVTTKLIKGLLEDDDLMEDLPRIVEALNQSLDHKQPDQPELELYENTRLIQIWRNDGRELLFRSPGAPDHALAPMKAGFYHHKSDKREWMVYVIDLHTKNASGENGPAKDAWLMVGEYPHARQDIIYALGGIFGVSGIVALILCTLIALAAIEYGLGPIRQLGSRLRRRSVDNLQPIQLHRTPKELQPVVDGLNEMFSRLAGGLERERRFVDDAAHELRTPLAVLKLQSQRLQTLPPEQLNEALKELETGTERTSRLLEQLLILARMDNNQQINSSRIDLAEPVRRTLAAMQWQADVHRVELTLDAADNLPAVNMDPSLLEMAVRNLVDNAIRYGGDGHEVETRLCQEGTALYLSVRDHGPGVPADDLQRLTERFFRAGNRYESIGSGDTAEQYQDSGAGLGLSIVSRIMETCGGELLLENAQGGGLRVTLVMPLPQDLQWP